MAGSLSRRGLLKIGGGVAVAGIAAAVAGNALAEDVTPAATWKSKLVYPGADGRLIYAADSKGKKIADFSWAGYRNGEAPLPDVPVVKTIGPVSGDNTAHIQQALDEVGELPKDGNFRGALLLKPGHYKVAGTIKLKRSGVVLRGSGKGGDTNVNTVITGTGDSSVNAVLSVGGTSGSWDSQVPDTKTNVTSSHVEAGSRRLTLASTAKLRVGDNIIIYHPCTQQWLDAINGGGVKDQPKWKVGSQPLVYNRYIKQIEGNDIVICAPVFNALNKSYSQSYVYKWDQAGLVRNVGVENLRIDMGSPAAEDENHQKSCISVTRAEDAWVRNSSLMHFSVSGVVVQRSTRVTVQDVRASHPRSQLIGERRYNFSAASMAQQVLFRGLWATHARHAFVATGSSTSSGIVWLDGYNENGYSESGGHQRWSQGLLYDNIKELSSQSDKAWVLSLHNRGDLGSGHGWSSVNSVAWNCTVDSGKRLCIQRPPTSQNFAIGTTGAVSSVNWYNTHQAGYVEGTNKPGLEPKSLYLAQLADRLGTS
ncbi:peptidoglycan-binding protein [Stackebrandtia soli]|uniref:peptidoglycan-binding protein n=1 Tax=Stackebrandtia soli TaxID=1892856 RepID=UPI0039E9D83B